MKNRGYIFQSHGSVPFLQADPWKEISLGLEKVGNNEGPDGLLFLNLGSLAAAVKAECGHSKY